MTVAIIGPGTIGAAHAAAWREVGVEVSHLVSRRADATLQDAPDARTVTHLDVVLGGFELGLRRADAGDGLLFLLPLALEGARTLGEVGELALESLEAGP